MSVIIRWRHKPSKDGVRYWYAAWETYPGGQRRARSIAKSQYIRYGLTEKMSYEEARAVADQFNAADRKTRLEEKRMKILSRIEESEKEDLLNMPPVFAEAFIKEKMDEALDKGQQKRIKSRWHAARKLVKELKIETFEWSRRRKAVYQYFAQQALSPDYVRKIISLMNQWGEFLSDKQNRPFKPIPQPRGGDRQVILDAYEDALKAPKDSLPISFDELKEAKKSMQLDHWKWVYVTLWFGLRPDEMRVLYKGAFHYQIEEIQGVRQVVFYQPKKRRMAKAKRYKRVPILFPEQEEALKYIEQKEMAEPLPATMKRHFKKRVHLYAGRKGFQDLMTGKGRSFFEIQDWLGHEDINRTWASYKNRQRALIEKKIG